MVTVAVKKLRSDYPMTQQEFVDQQLSLSVVERNAKIAELAYLKAEKRGFEPGHELEDWFEAEQELAFSQE